MKIMQGAYEPVDNPMYDASLLELLNTMLSYDPAHRPAANQIMAHVSVIPTLFSLYVDMGAILSPTGN
ncbi:hypothetical protein PR048_007396 [Dryococelus australis]|uniref:Uncharacterized protein n=1 Tax=Dryococelus australis TaxID=614101 RepID=A0ABQ9HU44_9NEOP|nr:hypothetical protein PR048_007396 [Dryococelus australis]